MNETATPNAYLKTKVLTASREELRLLLIDGAIKFANQALDGLERTDHEQIYNGFTQCRDIVLELLNSIKPEHSPEVAKNMQDLYTFMYGQLIKASIEKDPEILREVISLLEYDRETWVMAMERLNKEREGVAETADGAGDTLPTPKPISVQA